VVVTATIDDRDVLRVGEATGGPPAIEIDAVSRRFGAVQALDGVSFAIAPGEIHALLGPNGAGKTTLLRVITGLVEPEGGQVRVLGRPTTTFASREFRRLIGLVPSGDRTFYLRISGLENLVFFGRLHGLRRAAATGRAWEVLEAVELVSAARRRVGLYSHGMQKRLSVARALLMDPAVLLIDEATHDLDPDGALRTRRLAENAAARGASVVWATQRLDEIRGFAHRVTLLDRGSVRFAGTVPELTAVAMTRRYLLRLAHRAGADVDTARAIDRVRAAVGARGVVTRADDGAGSDVVLVLEDDAVLSDAITAIAAAGLDVVACREERSMVEEAFLRLTGGGAL
jgi:ABC-2 type transport system ATP-binding protein